MNPPARTLRLWKPAGTIADVFFVGAHGGAGETTLATLLRRSVATDHRWPSPDPAGPPARAVLVGRTSWTGLEAVQAAIAQWAAGRAGHCDLLAVVLSADAPGKRPKDLDRFIQLVSGGHGQVYQLPWINEWRLESAAAPGITAPPAVTRLLGDITALAYPRTR